MKLSARNVLKGKVKQIVTGAVNTEIIVKLADRVEIASIITNASAEKLALKASNVMIGVED